MGKLLGRTTFHRYPWSCIVSFHQYEPSCPFNVFYPCLKRSRRISIVSSFYSFPYVSPDDVKRTKSNVESIERNRTQSNDCDSIVERNRITIESGNRCKIRLRSIDRRLCSIDRRLCSIDRRLCSIANFVRLCSQPKAFTIVSLLQISDRLLVVAHTNALKDLYI